MSFYNQPLLPLQGGIDEQKNDDKSALFDCPHFGGLGSFPSASRKRRHTIPSSGPGKSALAAQSFAYSHSFTWLRIHGVVALACCRPGCARRICPRRLSPCFPHAGLLHLGNCHLRQKRTRGLHWRSALSLTLPSTRDRVLPCTPFVSPRP